MTPGVGGGKRADRTAKQCESNKSEVIHRVQQKYIQGTLDPTLYVGVMYMGGICVVWGFVREHILGKAASRL